MASLAHRVPFHQYSHPLTVALCVLLPPPHPPWRPQIATTADDATIKVWNIRRQQPEEAADDGTPRQPWVYPWQQAQQVQAAAAAAAAYGDVGLSPGSATPAAPWSEARAAAASAVGSPAPWSTASGGSVLAGLGGSRSASLLAALRGATGPSAVPAAGTPVPASLAQQQQQSAAALVADENAPANLHRQQQQQPPASAQQQQQQQQVRVLLGGVSASATASPRPFPLTSEPSCSSLPCRLAAAWHPT